MKGYYLEEFGPTTQDPKYKIIIHEGLICNIDDQYQLIYYTKDSEIITYEKDWIFSSLEDVKTKANQMIEKFKSLNIECTISIDYMNDFGNLIN